MTDLTDRARGALAGVAVGDAIGAPFEGARRVAVADLEAVIAGAVQVLQRLADGLISRSLPDA